MEVHGKNTVLTVNAADISQFCKTSTIERGGEVRDLTGYGSDDKKKGGSLRDSKFSCGGTYDNTATTGPGAALKPFVMQTVEVVRKLEGTGTGKPEETFDAVLAKYVETAPHDDYVSWTAEFEISGAITETTQA